MFHECSYKCLNLLSFFLIYRILDNTIYISDPCLVVETTRSVLEDNFPDNEISWSFGSCQSPKHSYTYTEENTVAISYQHHCCLQPGRHKLECKSSAGIGWTGNGAFLRVLPEGAGQFGAEYNASMMVCENFTSGAEFSTWINIETSGNIS